MSRKRLFAAAFVAVALAGLAAGLLTSRGSGAGRARPAVLSSGRFVSRGWSTTGRATIVRLGDGSVRLRLRDLRTQPAPELYVLLARPGGNGGRQTVAALESARGNQEYRLPSDVASSPRRTVLIYCAKCNRVWGSARLHLRRQAS